MKLHMHKTMIQTPRRDFFIVLLSSAHFYGETPRRLMRSRDFFPFYLFLLKISRNHHKYVPCYKSRKDGVEEKKKWPSRQELLSRKSVQEADKGFTHSLSVTMILYCII